MTKSRIVDLLKLAVALALLVWLFMRLPDPAALWQQILDANKMLLLLGALCYTAAVALSGLKWGVLLRAAGIQVPSTRLLSYQWMAEFFNNFLPAQVGGDVMRGYAVAVDTRRKADATASVLIDRFIGLIVFMLFAALASSAMLIWGKPRRPGRPGPPVQSSPPLAADSCRSHCRTRRTPAATVAPPRTLPRSIHKTRDSPSFRFPF